ncbi:tyrosine-type recombinase/integrase [Pseudonocardia sp. NPDC049635]|uniref:tyrosine-type recombinase/integrase n=1 Tax=Pseudonocardia sp. NPDC049635 TaxID=3155506 RepID=UPI0033CB7E9C
MRCGTAEDPRKSGRWVATQSTIAVYSPRTLAAQWHVIRTAAGLGRMRFHDLRHTAVSLLLALGVPPHVVREIVGHSDVKVTMTVYAHGNVDEKAAALSQLSTAVTGGLLSPVVVNEDQADRS